MRRTIGKTPTFISSAMEAIMCIKQEMTTIWPVENRLYKAPPWAEVSVSLKFKHVQ